jgi:YfiH family protein
MQRFKEGHLEWLEFDLLKNFPRLQHAVFLRQGGHSLTPFHQLNVSYSVGDNPLLVDKNRSLIENRLKRSFVNEIKMIQGEGCHGHQVASIHKNSPQTIPLTDGLICATPGIALLMTHADCQIGLFYDPQNHVIANIHSGWRGSVQNIYAHTIAKMRSTFGSNPANLLVCISPSLGPNESEFVNYQNEFPQTFWEFQIKTNYFDFWNLTEQQLKKEGILPHHIEVAKISTYTNPLDYFSYRRDKITGRNGTAIMLL